MNFDTFMFRLKQWMDQPHMFVVDNVRMKEIKSACESLKKIVGTKTEIEIDENILNDGSIAISVEVDEIVVTNIQDFVSIIKTANNFEVYPLLNGNIKFAIMFEDAMKLIK